MSKRGSSFLISFFFLLFIQQSQAARMSSDECFREATSLLSSYVISDEKAVYLCKGCRSDYVLRCFRYADGIHGLALSEWNAAILCQGATSWGPVECFKRSKFRLSLSDRNAAVHCQGSE